MREQSVAHDSEDPSYSALHVMCVFNILLHYGSLSSYISIYLSISGTEAASPTTSRWRIVLPFYGVLCAHFNSQVLCVTQPPFPRLLLIDSFGE